MTKQKEEGKTLSRKFLGKLDNFVDKQERNFETTHLKAYLRGNTHFRHGFQTLKTGERVPKFHEVKQEYYFIYN